MYTNKGVPPRHLSAAPDQRGDWGWVGKIYKACAGCMSRLLSYLPLLPLLSHPTVPIYNPRRPSRVSSHPHFTRRLHRAGPSLAHIPLRLEQKRPIHTQLHCTPGAPTDLSKMPSFAKANNPSADPLGALDDVWKNKDVDIVAVRLAPCPLPLSDGLHACSCAVAGAATRSRREVGGADTGTATESRIALEGGPTA